MRVLIVEDELIIAQDLGQTLRRIGHTVVGTVGSGEAALAAVAGDPPDLVLMDIRLSGAMDGIEAARQIASRWGLPVIFLTAHADDRTVREALLAEPWAYLLKPFDERELEVSIAVAAYKHRLERRLHASERHLRTTLISIGEGVIVTDGQSRISFVNPVAARLLGVIAEEVVGWPLARIYTLVATSSGLPADSAAGDSIGGLPAPATLLTRSGQRLLVEHSVAPIVAEDDTSEGVVIVFRDVSDRQRAIGQLQDAQRRLSQATAQLAQRDTAITALGALAGALQRAADLPAAYAAIVAAGAQVLPSYRGTLLVRDPASGEARPVGSWGDPLVRRPVPVCGCWGDRRWTLSLAGDGHGCQLIPAGLLGERMCLPILRRGEPVAMLCLYHPEPSASGGYQLAVAIAQQASLALGALG